MKKILSISLLLSIIVLQLFGQSKIDRTYCGLTIGQTTFNEAITSLKCTGNDMVPIPLTVDETSFAYIGRFNVDGMDFSVVVGTFFNDTLFRLEFVESSLNYDMSSFFYDFMQKEQAKYSSFDDKFNLMRHMDALFIEQNMPVPINKTDGITNISILDNKYRVSFKVEDAMMTLLWIEMNFVQPLNQLIKQN